MLKHFITVLLACFLLCGCSSNKNEITFSSWGSVSEVKILKKAISDFEDETGIKVKFMHIPQNYFQKIHLLFASNTAPDVLFINNLNMPVYADFLEDLSDIDTESFYPQSIEGLSYNNKLMAIPRDVSNLVFYVNLDMVELPIRDFNDIINRKIKIGTEFETYFALPYLWAFGEKDGIEFYKDLSRKYKVAPLKSEIGSSTLAQMFLDKKIALYLSGHWMYPKISEKADFNWTIIPFFYPVPCDVSGWAISKNSKHKEEAKQFIEFLASKKMSEYFYETGLVIPARKDVKINEGVFLEVLKTSKKTPVDKNYKKFVDKINLELER